MKFNTAKTKLEQRLNNYNIWFKDYCENLKKVENEDSYLINRMLKNKGEREIIKRIINA